ncbi:MAG: hypothetical protein JNM63_05205, partial [Spirochaetia bacterium]|nr:hypothetical protein [Spirochaetia bacterium]
RKKALLDFYAKNVRAGAATATGQSTSSGAPVKKIFFIGDSITKHGPSEKLGWSGNHGMAASSEEKDYPHLLVSRFASAQGSKPELLVHAVGGGTIAGKLSSLEPIQTAGADMVVVQLGENDRESTEEAFEKPYENLVTAIKKSMPTAKLFCLSVWKGSEEKDAMIQVVCRRQGAVYVDMVPFWKDPAGSAEAEKRFSNGGVNWHPGDKGMQSYADALWKAFQENPKMPAAELSAKRRIKAAGGSETVFEDLMDDESSKKWQPAIYTFESGKNGKALSINNDDASKNQSVSLNLPVDKIKGKKITVSALVKADKVSAKPKPYNGVKLMLITSDAEARKDYPQAPIETGTFDWKQVSFTYSVPDMVVSAQLVLGLEVVAGKVLFDEVRVSVEK